MPLVYMGQVVPRCWGNTGKLTNKYFIIYYNLDFFHQPLRKIGEGMGRFESIAEAVLVIGFYERKDGTVMVPLTCSDAWPLPMWRIQGGGQRFGETPEQAVRRECTEEIGLVLRYLRLVKTIRKDSRSPEFSDHYQHIFVGEFGSIDGFLEQTRDGKENLTSRLFTVTSIRECIRTGSRLGQYPILRAHGMHIEEVLRILFD